MNSTPLVAMRRISELLQAGNYQDAHTELVALVAANPQFVEGLRLLAGTHQVMGDTVRAEQLLRRALALDSNWAPTLMNMGELLIATGRDGEGLPLLRKAATGRARLPRAAFLLARHYNERGQFDEALAVAAPLCLAGHVDADLASQHIAALAGLGRQDDAVATYRHLAASAPENPARAHALAIALAAAQQPTAAEQIAAAVLQSGYRSAGLLNLYAGNLTARGALPEAETALREALRLEPRLIDAHSNLAKLIWMRTGDIGQSTALMDQVLETFGEDTALRAAKAAILQGSGDARAAYACLEERAAHPQAPPMLLVRAGLAALDVDPATAQALAQRALLAMPHHAAARSLLAAACLGCGDAPQALALCEHLLEDSPDDQYLIALQTTAWRLLGDTRYRDRCDYAELVVAQQLEVPPGWNDLAGFLADVRTSLNRLHDPHGHPLLFQSLRHGTETTGDLRGVQDPVVRALFGAFAEPIRRYLAHLGSGSDALRRRNRGRWRFNGSWSVRLRRSGYHATHVHPRGWVSSACYIDLPDVVQAAQTRQGVLTFGEPGVATQPPLGAEYSVQPQVGMLVLFPSYLWHGTVPFDGDQPRLTVAFDVVPEPAPPT